MQLTVADRIDELTQDFMKGLAAVNGNLVSESEDLIQDLLDEGKEPVAEWLEEFLGTMANADIDEKSATAAAHKLWANLQQAINRRFHKNADQILAEQGERADDDRAESRYQGSRQMAADAQKEAARQAKLRDRQ